jgi:acyl-CoA hydrolase
VEVVSEDPRTGERRKCCDAYLTFVGLDGAGRPTAVVPLAAGSDDERRREREARARREARLGERGRSPGA